MSINYCTEFGHLWVKGSNKCDVCGIVVEPEPIDVKDFRCDWDFNFPTGPTTFSFKATLGNGYIIHGENLEGVVKVERQK